MTQSYTLLETEYEPKLEEYLPPIYNKFVETDALMLAENELFKKLWEVCKKAWSDQFVLTASLDGIKSFEQIFNIIANPTTESLDFRRQRVINRFSTRPPFTISFLKQRLYLLLTQEYCDIDIDYENYTLRVTINHLAGDTFYESAYILRQVVPANMILDLKKLFEFSSQNRFIAQPHCFNINSRIYNLGNYILRLDDGLYLDDGWYLDPLFDAGLKMDRFAVAFCAVNLCSFINTSSVFKLPSVTNGNEVSSKTESLVKVQNNFMPGRGEIKVMAQVQNSYSIHGSIVIDKRWYLDDCILLDNGYRLDEEIIKEEF